MGGAQVGRDGGGLEYWGDECSVNEGDGERLLPKLSATFS